jgi:hypothetical protein
MLSVLPGVDFNKLQPLTGAFDFPESINNYSPSPLGGSFSAPKLAFYKEAGVENSTRTESGESSVDKEKVDNFHRT